MEIAQQSTSKTLGLTTIKPSVAIVDANQLSNKVLERLMEEVKNENLNDIFAYDRAHNRHNRGK